MHIMMENYLICDKKIGLKRNCILNYMSFLIFLDFMEFF